MQYAEVTTSERGVETADHLTLHTRRVEPSRGVTDDRSFVLVHGLASNAMMFTGVGLELGRRGHTSVAVDLRGHGRSSRPGRTFAERTLRDDLRRVVDAHGLERPVLVGQSWGGNVVLDVAAALPELVSAVIAIDGGIIDLASSFDDLDGALDALHPPALAGTPLTAIEAGIRAMHTGWPETAIQGALANFLVRDDGTVEPRLALDEHLAILRTMWEQHPQRVLAAVSVPALLVMVPTGDTGWAARKRGAVDVAEAANPLVSSRWLDGYEHDVHAQAPELVAELMLEWLTEERP